MGQRLIPGQARTDLQVGGAAVKLSPARADVDADPAIVDFRSLICLVVWVTRAICVKYVVAGALGSAGGSVFDLFDLFLGHTRNKTSLSAHSAASRVVVR